MCCVEERDILIEVKQRIMIITYNIYHVELVLRMGFTMGPKFIKIDRQMRKI